MFTGVGLISALLRDVIVGAGGVVDNLDAVPLHLHRLCGRFYSSRPWHKGVLLRGAYLLLLGSYKVRFSKSFLP